MERINNKMNNNALIVFAVNPVVNIEKSRLALRYHDKQAVKAYLNNLKNIYQQTRNLDSQKFLFLDMAFNQKNYDTGYQICLQYGNDASMKIYHAFEKIFNYGHYKAVVLAADIPKVKQETVEEAFKKLDEYDVVVGPTAENGFYLLGTKEPIYKIFDNVLLNENSVLDSLLVKIKSLGKTYFLLDSLSNSNYFEISSEESIYYPQLKQRNN